MLSNEATKGKDGWCGYPSHLFFSVLDRLIFSPIVLFPLLSRANLLQPCNCTAMDIHRSFLSLFLFHFFFLF